MTFLVLIWMMVGHNLNIYALYYLVGYTTVSALALLVSVRFIVRHFVRYPLMELTSGLKKAEKGDFLNRVNIQTSNEIGQLAENFNRLMARFTDLMAAHLDTERELDETQAELALENKLAKQAKLIRNTNAELQDRIKYLSLLYEISTSINSIIEPDQLYRSLVRIISEQLGYEEFAILILDPKDERLHVRASHGFDKNAYIEDVTFGLGEGISGIVAQTGKKQLIRDTAKDKRYLHYKGHHAADGSFLCVPLKVKGSVLGVFNLFRPIRNGFSSQEIRLITAIANQAAIAIENAQLFNSARQLAVTDELTGVANRRHFKNMLDLEKKRSLRFGKAMTLLMIDVDNFKKFNDTQGHLEGDEVLKRIAQLMNQNIREVDLIARFGGEEFIALLTNTNSDEAYRVGEKLREIIAKEKFKGEEILPEKKITISIGVACCPDDTEDMNELENLADLALYEAKRQGKNKVVKYKSILREKSVGLG